MFTLLKLLPWRQLLAEQLPALVAAWAIAELFYKFKSFSLETAAFLATWFVIDATVQAVKRAMAPPVGTTTTTTTAAPTQRESGRA